MAYFTVTGLKVLISLFITQGICPGNAKEPDLSVVAKILQNLFKTYSHSMRESRNFVIDTDRPPQLESSVEIVINRKIQELKPFLQDDDPYEKVARENKQFIDSKKAEHKKGLKNEDDNVTLEGEEETTIIEFDPNTNPNSLRQKNAYDPTEFKDNVKKYKQIRDEIKSALIDESVSYNTQKLIIHSLDDMLAIMVRNQCPANSNLDGQLRHSKTNRDLAKDWTDQWHAIKNKYNKIWRTYFSPQPNPARKLFMFFEQIQDFLQVIVKDTDHISNNYKVVCKLVKKKNMNEQVSFNNVDLVNFRTGEEKKKFNCHKFKMCSDELRQFMGRFYNNLNETAVSTFRNYAAMYMSDINSDGSGEKESIIEGINRLGNSTQQKINKIFKKSTENFEINHDKDKDENIRLLRLYISNIIDQCLITIKSSVNGEIMNQRARLIETLKQDLKSNIDIDLENLAAELKEGICRHFSSCNGRIMRRSFHDFENEIKAKVHSPIDKNKVYVKLQMNFDKKMKQDIAQGKINIFDYALMPMKNIAREQAVIVTQVINVTRTTQPDWTTKNNLRSHPSIMRQMKAEKNSEAQQKKNLELMKIEESKKKLKDIDDVFRMAEDPKYIKITESKKKLKDLDKILKKMKKKKNSLLRKKKDSSVNSEIKGSKKILDDLEKVLDTNPESNSDTENLKLERDLKKKKPKQNSDPNVPANHLKQVESENYSEIEESAKDSKKENQGNNLASEENIKKLKDLDKTLDSTHPKTNSDPENLKITTHKHKLKNLKRDLKKRKPIEKSEPQASANHLRQDEVEHYSEIGETAEKEKQENNLEGEEHIKKLKDLDKSLESMHPGMNSDPESLENTEYKQKLKNLKRDLKKRKPIKKSELHATHLRQDEVEHYSKIRETAKNSNKEKQENNVVGKEHKKKLKDLDKILDSMHPETNSDFENFKISESKKKLRNLEKTLKKTKPKRSSETKTIKYLRQDDAENITETEEYKKKEEPNYYILSEEFKNKLKKFKKSLKKMKLKSELKEPEKHLREGRKEDPENNLEAEVSAGDSKKNKSEKNSVQTIYQESETTKARDMRSTVLLSREVSTEIVG